MEKLEGMISDIVFKNEENGYTIAYLANEDEEVTIVGCMPTLSVGESIEVEGKWVTHKTYGSQFEVTSFMPITPSSLEGIYAYLSSGMIHGIGEKMATRIIEKFGVDTLDVIQNTPERLKEVEGIGSKKIKQITESYEENRELRNIIMQLSPYGIRVTDEDKLSDAFEEAKKNTDSPTIIEILIDFKDVVLPMVQGGKALDNMLLETNY